MNKDLTLYEIGQEFDKIYDLIEKNNGEITPEIEKLQEDCLILLREKTDGCCEFVSILETQIKNAKEKKELAERYIKARENCLAGFENIIKNCLRLSGYESFNGEMHQIKLRKATEIVEIIDDNKIPAKYLVTIPAKTSIDKKLLLSDLKNIEEGVQIPGAKIGHNDPSVMFGLMPVKKSKKKKEIRNGDE